MNRDVTVLAVETSCDETSAAVVRNGRQVLSNEVASQIKIHAKYGGVVPEIASRHHTEIIDTIIRAAMEDAGLAYGDIDAVVVTYGPGLVGALLTGVSTAKALAYALHKPIVGVHHIEGHIAANYIAYPELEPPFLCLAVSGGHTHLIHVKGYRDFALLGRTRDDAAGEAFDKVARVLGLGYPGGPAIDRVAGEGDSAYVEFPRVDIEGAPYDFSFSGLKTSVINHIHGIRQRGQGLPVADIAASFQQAVVDVLVRKSIMACGETGINTLTLAGGVSANIALREHLTKDAEKQGIRVYVPPVEYCTDNAAMIGCAGYYRYMAGDVSDLTLNAVPGLPL